MRSTYLGAGFVAAFLGVCFLLSTPAAAQYGQTVIALGWGTGLLALGVLLLRGGLSEN